MIVASNAVDKIYARA